MEVPGRLTLAQAGLSKDGADGAPQMHWKGRNAAPRSDQALVKSRAPPRVRRAGSNFPGVYLTFLGDFRMTADTPRGLIRGVRLPAMTGGQPLPALAVRRGSPFHRQVMETEKGGGASPPKVSLSPYSIVKRKTRGSQSRPRGLVPRGGVEAALCAHPGSPDTPAPSAASQSLSGGSPGRHPLGSVHTLPEHRLRQKQRDTGRLQILVVHGKLERELCLLRRHRRGTRPQRLMRSFWKRRGAGKAA